MLSVCRTQEERAMVALGGYGGLRISEVLEVRVSDFDWGNGLLVIRGGKGGKSRAVPLTSYIVNNCLSRIIEVGVGPLVSLANSSSRAAITRIASRANLSRHVASHDMRATFATAVHDSTMNMRAVQQLLGHAQITTTEPYTLVTQRALAAAADFGE